MDIFNIILIIDYDCLGIIYDFLKDNLDFLLILKKYNLKPKNKEIIWDELNWDEVSKRTDLSYIFISEFKPNLNFYLLTTNYMNDIKFLRYFKNDVDWVKINDKMSFADFEFDYSFFEEFQEYLDWDKLSRWRLIAEDFIDLFSELLNWDIISTCQGLTPYLLEKYNNKIKWDKIHENHYINVEWIDMYNPYRPLPSDEEAGNENNNNADLRNIEIENAELSVINEEDINAIDIDEVDMDMDMDS